MKLNTNEEVILSIIHRRDELTVTAVQSIKVNIIVETFRKEDETIKLMRQKSHDSRRYIENDGIHLSNFGITQIVKIFREFLNNNKYLHFTDLLGTIDMNENILEKN